MVNVASLKAQSYYAEIDYAEHSYSGSIEYNDIVKTLTMLVGFFQLIIWVLRLDILISMVSFEVFTAFGAGTVFHIAVAQLARFMGIKPHGDKIVPGYAFLVSITFLYYSFYKIFN